MCIRGEHVCVLQNLEKLYNSAQSKLSNSIYKGEKYMFSMDALLCFLFHF